MKRKAWSFLVTLVIGGGAVAFATLNQDRGVAVGAGVVAILSHLVLSMGTGRDEESADSSYFLGFLLTLVVLSAGLWNLAEHTASAAASTPPDVMSFLYDLASGFALTIVGLGVRQARVLSVDVVPESSERTDDARLRQLVECQQALTTSVTALAQKLDGSLLGETVEGANTALVSAQQAARELGTSLEDTATQMRSAASTLSETVTRVSSRLERATGRLCESLADQIDRTRSQIEQALAALEGQREKVEEALRASTDAAERTQRELGAELLEQRLEWKRNLETAHGTLVALHDAIETEYGRGMQAVARASASFTRLSEHVVQEMESLPDPSERLTSLWTGIENMDGRITSSSLNVSKALLALDERARSATTAVEALGQRADSATKSIDEGRQRAATALGTELRQIEQILEDFHRVLESRLLAMAPR